jgi:homoserine O-acetyltransferase
MSDHRRTAYVFYAVLSALVVATAATAQPPVPPLRVGSIRDCRVADGAVIPNCRVAYRTYGRLDDTRSNTVLIPTWLLGRSEDWHPLLGNDPLVDTTRFFVVVVDALGDGHSSSPSNTRGARAAFAALTVGDMVESQYRLLTVQLGIHHLRAVVGFSMGGMQAIEWAVRHSTFVDKIVPIAGSPRVGTFDQMMWTAMLNEIEDAHRAGAPADSVWARLAHMEMLFVQTPVALNSRGTDSVTREVAANARGYRRAWALEDYAAQLRAIREYDATRAYGGDLRRAAAEVRARVLAVYSWDDHMVTAGPVAAFARLVHADTLSIRSSCGHVMVFCEQKRVGAAIRAFIAQ